MKVVIALIAVVLLSTVSMPKAHASNVAQNICEYVAVDAKSKLRTYLKSNKIKIRKVFGNVKCNGKNLLEFAAINNSTNTGNMMIGKLSKKIVAANLSAISSTELHTAAEKRVNG